MSITAQQSRNQKTKENKTITLTIPNVFFCPISMSLLKDPVICCDGFTYERFEIKKWFLESECISLMPISPMTGLQLPSKNLISNIALRTLIHDFTIEADEQLSIVIHEQLYEEPEDWNNFSWRL